MTDEQKILKLVQEIHAQNERMLARVDELERTATKRGAVAGAVAGSITGGIMTVGIELIRAKFGF